MAWYSDHGEIVHMSLRAERDERRARLKLAPHSGDLAVPPSQDDTDAWELALLREEDKTE